MKELLKQHKHAVDMLRLIESLARPIRINQILPLTPTGLMKSLEVVSLVSSTEVYGSQQLIQRTQVWRWL